MSRIALVLLLGVSACYSVTSQHRPFRSRGLGARAEAGLMIAIGAAQTTAGGFGMAMIGFPRDCSKDTWSPFKGSLAPEAPCEPTQADNDKGLFLMGPGIVGIDGLSTLAVGIVQLVVDRRVGIADGAMPARHQRSGAK